ncbi:MAG: cation:proton antiporter [Nanoarchaeota archaeon]|nr:cation:proton antiporter [Nanoarchaeota archaeon]
MAQEVLLYISLIVSISALLTVFARLIKQPPIIAYLIAGILVGPLVFNLIGPANETTGLLQVFSHIGVAFLLFIVGLSLDFRVMKEVGKVATLAGLVEIALTGGIGFLIATAIGFQNTTALYLGAAIAFSSTVVVVKILADKKEIDTLHGRLTLGILIVEDLVAAIALMAVPLIQEGSSIIFIFQKLGIIIGLIAIIFFVTSFLQERMLGYLAKNQEGLFLFGIAWALILAALFDYLGFSLEIGALIAGMSLASSKYTLEIGGKMKPLRDFFMVLFFVFFGSQLAEAITPSLIKTALIFSIFIIIGKPLIIMSVLKLFGYTKRTNFLTSSSLAQVSEFSLILILLGFNLGHINQEMMSLLVLIAVITIGVSSYNIYYSHHIFGKISHLLSIFESKKHRIDNKEKKKEYEVFVFGYHRIGYKIIQSLKKMNAKVVVVDYNPKVIIALNKENIEAIYGDASDRNFLSEIGLEKAKLVISTIPQEDANIAIKETLKEIKSKAALIATAEQPRTALNLYNNGIDYVIVPHHLGGDYASSLIEKFGTSKKTYEEFGKKHFSSLKKGKDLSAFE